MSKRVVRLRNRLAKFLDADNIKLNEPLKNHTSFKIGGNCQLLVEPKTQAELLKIIKILKFRGFKYYVIGNGTNLLVKDKGVKAVIIKLGSKFKELKVEGNVIEALSGNSISQINMFAIENSLTGFEWSYGIPGTIGGGVVMNAGAYGGQISDRLISVKVFKGKKLVTLPAKKLKLGYRKSIFQRRPNYVIVSVKIKLEKGCKDEIEALTESCMEKRLFKQPYSMPSAGSVFKRHKNLIISKTIDELNLKGYSVGAAEISKKHAGFIVNKGDATFEDVMGIIKEIKKRVYKKHKAKLKLEVKILGD